jgi:hypothetical protein
MTPDMAADTFSRYTEEKTTLGSEVKAHVEAWAEQIKLYVESSRRATSVP